MITFIDTNECKRENLGGGRGDAAEVVSGALCGADEIKAHLRWLGEGDAFEAAPIPDAHQLIYVMEGEGVVSLEGKDYDVGPGAGLYLGPGEGASLQGAGALKAFHLIGQPK
jgi:glyoxylate utilization-related uncharacterized protein